MTLHLESPPLQPYTGPAMASQPDITTPDDPLDALVARHAAGDAAARAALLALASERLLSLVRQHLRNFPAVRRWEQTDDVLQGVLMRLDRALADTILRDARHFYALSSTLIRRELIDLKRHYYGPEGSGAHHHTAFPAADDTPRPTPVDIAASDTLDPQRLADWTDFHRSVETLPPELREVVDLLWYQGLTQDEAAARLNVASKTVSRRWREARIVLGKAFLSDA